MQTQANRQAVIQRNPSSKMQFDVLFEVESKDYMEDSPVCFTEIHGCKYEANRIISSKFIKLSWEDAQVALAAINGTKVEEDQPELETF